jgi:adenylate cyclase
MGVLATADIFLFDEFRLDRRGDGLSRRDEGGVFVPVSIGLRALDVLGVLVERSADLVSKEEIMSAVWGRTVVENANLTVQISALRRVLDQGRPEGSCIQTVAARGYRFVAPVTRVEHAASSPMLPRATYEGTSATRRLIAILAADVAGYSRLMGADEEGTLNRLKTHRRELVDPKIQEHRGRIVKTTGDGMLVEFGSVVDAARCAAEIQRGMLDRDLDMSDERRIRFRIGINLGDIIVDSGDIFGDGVNVAARLEALAEPGGVCVSHTVRDQIRDKLPYRLDDLGEQFVKNIARPVRAYALSPESVAALPAASVQRITPHRRRIKLATIAAAALAALVIAIVAWWVWPGPGSRTAGAPIAASAPQPFVAPRLSIVVLPFANLSNDPDQQYLADGVTEDLTTDLSRIAGMFVISRNTAFTYKNKPIDSRQIGRELGVRYLLEGSVQRPGKQVRVTAQLIAAETGAHLWAERFDRDPGDLFAVQDEVTRQIATALNTELIATEATRPTESPDALDYILRGRAAMAKGLSRDWYAEAVDWFERALAVDQTSIEAQAGLAQALTGRVFDLMTNTAAADLERAKGLIERVLVLSPRNPLAHYVKGKMLKFNRQCEDAIPEYEIAAASNRNWINPIRQMADCKFLIGAGDEVIPLYEQVIRLSPRDPSLAFTYTWIGVVHLFHSRPDEAIIWYERAARANPAIAAPHYNLAVIYGNKGDLARAAAELAEARKRDSTDRYTTIARGRANGDLNTPALHNQFEDMFLAGLRKAGMPEE